jgi:uracil-DNA glycosylase family 4
VQLEAITFWHKPIEGGVPVASSCVGPAPLDVPAAVALALRATSYPPITGMNRATLGFSAEGPADPLDGVKRVMAAYGQCARCHLCASRMQVVHYRGNASAVVAFLGEGPSKDENDLGEPFVGRPGKLQDEMLRQAGVEPAQLFWMHVLGCRPGPRWGDDRTATEPELIACSERTYLLLQAVRPRVVVCLGPVATKFFFDEPPPVWSFTQFSPAGAPDDWVMVGYARHPAYLGRCIGAPSMYKEYAAQRTFYSMLAGKLSGLGKVGRWLLLPRYLGKLSGAAVPLLSWPEGASGLAAETAE